VTGVDEGRIIDPAQRREREMTFDALGSPNWPAISGRATVNPNRPQPVILAVLLAVWR